MTTLGISGCAYLVTERSLSPQVSPDLGEDAIVVERAPRTVYIIHVRLAGDPNEARWEHGGRTVAVRSLPLSTTLWSWGPILPVIPHLPWLFMSSEPANLEIDVSVGGEPGPIRARLEDFALWLPDRCESVKPSGGARIPASAVSALRALNVSGETVVELVRERSMRLIYPVDRTTVEEATLTLRLASVDGSWTFHRTARFVRGGTTFVMTIP